MLTVDNQVSLRRVRSFVCRNSRMTKLQRQALSALLSHYKLQPEDGIVNLPVIFGRKAPCILEIGSVLGIL